MSNNVGFLTLFDGTTLVNHSDQRATDVVDNTSGVNVPLVILPNGTKVYYNGTSDSTTTPGRAIQRFAEWSDGVSIYGTLVGKLGHIGTLTKTRLGGTTYTCDAVLIGVRDVTPILRTRANMIIEVEFELLTDWTT